MSPGHAAAVAAAALGLAFALVLLVPVVDDGDRRARELGLGQPLQGGRIVALEWTGDRSRVVAVTRRGRHTAAVAVGIDGDGVRIAGRVQGGLDAYPSPVGALVATVRSRPNGRSRVAIIDSRVGTERWHRWTDGPTRVRWRPNGGALLIAAAHECRLAEGASGATIARAVRRGGRCPLAFP